MQTITTIAQYSRAKKALFLEQELPYTGDYSSYKVILQLIPLEQPTTDYKARMKAVLNKTYGLITDIPEGVRYVRQLRDKADIRVKQLWQ